MWLGSVNLAAVPRRKLRGPTYAPLEFLLSVSSSTCISRRMVVRSVNNRDKRGFECLNDDGNISKGNVCGEIDFPRL